VAGLAAVSAWAVFLFLVTAKWWFWPWYLGWLVPLAALNPNRRVALVGIIFSMTAMLMYVSYYWRVFNPDWYMTQRVVFVTVFAVPLVLAGGHVVAFALERIVGLRRRGKYRVAVQSTLVSRRRRGTRSGDGILRPLQ
jgi:hypothetical protein